MSVKITYFVHGTTLDNQAGISTGWNNIGLSELGKQQSLELKTALRDVQFDAVFHSDLQRSIDSTQLVFGDRDVPFHEDARLRECNYGDFNGAPSTAVEPMYEKCIETPFPNGESMQAVQIRLLRFLNDIRGRFDGKHIAIVAHKAPQLALEVLLRGRTWEQAIHEDWRLKKAWQPGWEYTLE